MPERPHRHTVILALASIVVSVSALGLSGFSVYISYENRVSPAEDLEIAIDPLKADDSNNGTHAMVGHFTVANRSGNPVTISKVEIDYGVYLTDNPGKRAWLHWFNWYLTSLSNGNAEQQIPVTIDPSKIFSEYVQLPHIEEENSHQAIEIHVTTSRDQHFFGARVTR